MATVHGVIHGKTIELNEAPGLPDGEPVVVTIERIPTVASPSGEESLPKVETWIDRIVFDSAVLPGERIVKGTKLSAETLVEELSNRDDEAMLALHPELASDDLVALRRYARFPKAFRLTFGAWAEDAEDLDRYIESLRERRRIARPEIAP